MSIEFPDDADLEAWLKGELEAAGCLSSFPPVSGHVDANHAHDYSIVAADSGVVLTARSTSRLWWAVGELLQDAGWHFLTPHPDWTIRPKQPIVPVLSRNYTRPYAFITGIGVGGGTPSWIQPQLTRWLGLHSATNEGQWPTGHAWAAIADRIPNVIERGLATATNKLATQAEEVREAAVAWAKERALRPGQNLVSLAASDGAGVGWQEPLVTGEGTTMTPTDRVVSLANHVQEALLADPATAHARVSVQAYGAVSPAPTQSVHPRVLVVAMQAVIQQQDPEEMIAAWRAQGAVDVARYFYWSVYSWARDGIRASRLQVEDKLASDAQSYADSFAVLGESSPSWSGDAPGMWATLQVLSGQAQPVHIRWRADRFGTFAWPTASRKATALMQFIRAQNEAEPPTVELAAELARQTTELYAKVITPAEKRRAADWMAWAVYCHRLALWRLGGYRSPDRADALWAWMHKLRYRGLFSWRMIAYDPLGKADRTVLEERYGLNLKSTHLLEQGQVPDHWKDEPSEAEILAEVSALL